MKKGKKEDEMKTRSRSRCLARSVAVSVVSGLFSCLPGNPQAQIVVGNSGTTDANAATSFQGQAVAVSGGCNSRFPGLSWGGLT